MNIYLTETTISRELRKLDDSIFSDYLKPISSDFDLFLDRYVKGERGHNERMAYSIIKIMSAIDFEDIYLFNNFINIADELKENGLVVGDLFNSANWGFKNGHLAIFDIGYGDDWRHLDDVDTISETDEMREPSVRDNKIRSIAKKMGVDVIKYLGGQNYGYAYEVTGNKVLKLTRDQTEARNCLKIQGKEMKYIANVYKVYKYSVGENRYYLILLEQLNTKGLKPIIERYNNIDYFIFNLWNSINRRKKA